MDLATVFDTETTGLPEWKEPSGSDKQPHIVQLAAHQVDRDTQKVIQTLNVIVKPEGWVSSPEALETHGITTEYAGDVGVPEKIALEMFLEMMGGRLHIAHNTTFDRRMIRIGLKRYFGDRIADEFKEAPYECTMIQSRKVMPISKNPTLAEAYKHFTGKELVDAHTAIADTNACLDIYWALQNLKQDEQLNQAAS